MSATGPSNNGTNDTQVSGYEREIEKQKAKEKAQKEAFEKYSKENLNPTDNTQTINKNKQNLAEHERVMRENRGNQVVQSPTTSEVSQVTETEQTTSEETTTEVEKPEEDDITIRKRKTKARGRSPTILTGVTGVTDGLTLGKPSLLGR
jgi:hypothetical protein